MYFTKRVSNSTNLTPKKIYVIEPIAQCYRTLYDRNLQMFVVSQSVFLGMAFQPSLKFVSKAAAYPSEATFRCSTLGQALDLTYKLEQDGKAFQGQTIQLITNI